MSSTNLIIAALSGLLLIAVIVSLVLWRGKRRAADRIEDFNQQLRDVSADASVGRRLSVPADPDAAVLATTINQLFDAVGERDEKIQGRDQLFRDFSKTLPEIVLIHDDKILLANESAAGLIGLEPEQIVGRDVADLVKPAYRALFRKNVAKRLSGENVPRRLEIQLINGNDAGLWVEAQSSNIEFHGDAGDPDDCARCQPPQESRGLPVAQQAPGAVHAGVDFRRCHHDG